MLLRRPMHQFLSCGPDPSAIFLVEVEASAENYFSGSDIDAAPPAKLARCFERKSEAEWVSLDVLAEGKSIRLRSNN